MTSGLGHDPSMDNFDAKALLTPAQVERDPDWLAEGYNAAFERIAKVNEHGIHWESKDDMTRPGDTLVYAWTGVERTPDEARRRAFELLVHADIADAQMEPQ